MNEQPNLLTSPSGRGRRAAPGEGDQGAHWVIEGALPSKALALILSQREREQGALPCIACGVCT